jgi:hypothetical protein
MERVFGVSDQPSWGFIALLEIAAQAVGTLEGIAGGLESKGLPMFASEVREAAKRLDQRKESLLAQRHGPGSE